MANNATDNTSRDEAHRGRGEIRKVGISASRGIVVGKAFLRDAEVVVVPTTKVAPGAIDDEIQQFRTALASTRSELDAIRANLAERIGEDHARIFDAHMLILDDDTIVEETISRVRKTRLNAAAAFKSVVDKVLESFGEMEDEYLKERYVDVRDVKRRVLAHLMGTRRGQDGPTEPSVIVAPDLAPSDTAQFERRLTLAYVTDSGGRTSHTAILARSQGLPAVVGLEDLFAQVHNGDKIIVDGNTGTVVVNPTPETIEEYKIEIKRFKELEDQLLTMAGYPAVTLDDREFVITANLDLPNDVDSVLDYGGQGIGLFRTEFFFINADVLPSEDEQYKAYRGVIEKMGGRPVVVRTLDIGGDKDVDYLARPHELNPYMGWRGIRFCLARPDIFKSQLRAIYRASTHGDVKIMFPMIASVEEVVAARKVCEEVRDELTRERVPFAADVPLGIMIETPASAALADLLAREADFFSIGTNDLMQYTLAVDRGNSKIAHLYRNLHPAVVRALRSTIEAANKRDIPVSVCGEMGGDPRAVVLMIGMGVDQISCGPYRMPEVKRIIRSVTHDECKTLLKRVMRFRTTKEIEEETERFLRERIPDLPSWGGFVS